MSKIYAICDKGLLDRFGLDIEDFVKISNYFNVAMIQYRDKNSFIEEKRENLKILKKLSKAPVIVNDFLELVNFADGIHLGQEDILNICESFGYKSRYEVILAIRKIIGRKIVGLSTHNESEIKEANILDLDYIGLGAYRKTSTKESARVIKKDIFSLIKLSKHPVAIIGGVRVFDNIKVDYKAIGSDLIIKWLTYS